MPKHPNVKVRLIGGDSNAFGLISLVGGQLRTEVGPAAEKEFVTEALDKGSYGELLALILETVSVV